MDDNEFIAYYESKYITNEQTRRKIFSSTFQDGSDLLTFLDSITEGSNAADGSKRSTKKSPKPSKEHKNGIKSPLSDDHGPVDELCFDSNAQEDGNEPKGRNKNAKSTPNNPEFEKKLSWKERRGQVIAHLNRVSEGNLGIIIKELAKVISSLKLPSLTHEIITDFVDLIIKFSISNEQSQPSIIATYSGIIFWLSSISPEIAYAYTATVHDLLKKSIKPLVTLANEDEMACSKKLIKNCIISLSSLLHFELLDIEIMCDIIHLITDNDMSCELSHIIITWIRHCGYIIQLKSPRAFQQIKSYILEKIEVYKSNCSDYSKSVVRFLELEINENNKKSNELPLDNVKETLKGHCKSSTFVSKLNFENFINSPHRNTNLLKALKHVSSEYSLLPTGQSNETSQLLNKASLLGLSNSIQKSVFLILMRSHDSSHASKIIIDSFPSKSNILNIVKTILTCLLAERQFNPYYVQVIEHLSNFGNKAWNKSFKYTLRCTMHNHYLNMGKYSKRKKGVLQVAVGYMIGKGLVDSLD